MNLPVAALITAMLMLMVGCDDSVSSTYSTRAEAEADNLFDRGWLPEIVPPSSKSITMTNDLDLNTSNGQFKFDPADYSAFVAYLERTPSQDKDGASAYSYEDWVFWISPNKSECSFYMQLTRNQKQSEQGVVK